MAGLPTARPAALGFDERRLQRAFDLLKKWCDDDKVLGAGLCVGRRGRMIEPRFFGKQHASVNSKPIRDDALFLVASITKPVTVTCVLKLVERGELSLEDRVASIVPAFAAKHRDKAEVQVRHLMTHTSGLPDMLPDNEKLRKGHKPTSAFVQGACEVLVRRSISSTAGSYCGRFSRFRQSSSVIFHCLYAVYCRSWKRRSCSAASICSQNFTITVPKSTSCRSKRLISS